MNSDTIIDAFEFLKKYSEHDFSVLSDSYSPSAVTTNILRGLDCEALVFIYFLQFSCFSFSCL